ncbi:lipoyl(octanoyl) transferase LipB [Legionella waltersii]|uniref:Octanoyltransferase n=1 Tax=Legionella waltersii TaxID=66969 RepID=A0A0W1A158_9GAMM|nr:lipoyl(octanoyl) transferase LipB [Legionella waltersii]KTD75086.1 lipoyltransferase [Legionella waltersii]SNV05185.1 lipoyl(octanoyl) transferase [Legionella waltersii]
MIIRQLGIKHYSEVWLRMKELTIARNETSEDELWLLEHFPIYTQGQAGKPEHILNPKSIEIIQSDRGGQVTYHGPGQLVAYILMDIRRRNLGIRTLVSKLEQVLISLLKEYQIDANIRCGAPGVYVNDKKIASIGLRVKNGCTYHGIALNTNMDLTPFSGINPCGYARMEMTQISDFIPSITVDEVSKRFSEFFLEQF